jgi:hypothetical protein
MSFCVKTWVKLKFINLKKKKKKNIIPLNCLTSLRGHSCLKLVEVK